jgi:diguanylate cyclase (GGDEF)-like protein/putative nucleotidyltransferase with HDIG domain
MSLKAKIYVYIVIGCGISLFCHLMLQWRNEQMARFVVYLGIALLGSGMKVSLPSITGTMSVNFFFILVGLVELNLPQTLVVGCGSIMVQYIWKNKGGTSAIQALFNIASVTMAIAISNWVFHGAWLDPLPVEFPLRLALAACAYFVANTVPVAVVISLTEGKVARRVWRDCYFWSFPYYLVGAGGAGVFSFVNRTVGWQSAVLGLPAVYVMYRSYFLYLGRLTAEKTRAEDQRRHADEMSLLHLRTIEALAMAIEAKDHTTHDHLARVQVYAIEIGREMGLDETNLEAIRAASILHDIGKLAVPEHIISKPGKLTPEEFEKMKIHPVVGAEILARVKFPGPVVPIVRSHHERWNGTGYPDGLAGVRIPIGARIISAVDCLDALATDRQYRRALPLDEAMDVVEKESGISFDPDVVRILRRRYKELEVIAKSTRMDLCKLSTGIKVEKGEAPAAGFESSGRAGGAPRDAKDSMQFVHSISAARHEAHVLFEMAQEMGNSLSLNETLSVLALRLKNIVPYDGMAVYLKRDDHLIPEFVTGDEFRLFNSLRIPLGQGLSGWVADNRKPIVNGNPSVEPGYLNDPKKFSMLRSALAVPLEGTGGVVGTLALYDARKDAFTQDHLRILLAVSSKLGLSIENSLKFKKAEDSATIDFLTGLPNARALFLHLEQEVERCSRRGEPLLVAVGDLNGFKTVNDRFGHLVGNQLLQAVAKGLKQSCRESDYVARMGGDEFVIVLPGVLPHPVERVIERFQQACDEEAAPLCGPGVVSLSVGYAMLGEERTAAEELLAEADRNMYAAKRNSKRTADDRRLTLVPSKKIVA